jgi:alcohol dehydrogenase (cytochrome c)
MTFKSGRLVTLGALLAILAWGGLVAGQEISSQQLLAGLTNPSTWLTYSGDYSGQRHSPLRQITPANVQQLAVQWAFQTGVPGRFQAVPIVVDGVIYITGPNNNAWAIDGLTGRRLWTYQHEMPDLPGTNVNRGFAVFGNKLYMTTIDAHLVALDMKTGNVVWDSVIAERKRGYYATIAPLVVKNKVIVGIGGADEGTRGFIDAFDAETGKRSWRFWTVPEPGQPGNETWTGNSWERGGGSTWLTGTYDPESNVLYWGTGNPAPDLLGEVRKGDNLYTASVVALDADTGKLRWHYQFTPHDTRDWDAVQIPVLADINAGGTRRKVLMLANRNGFFYTLDRTDGKLIRARPFVRTTWANEVGADGRPVELPGSQPTEKGSVICPDVTGATNWNSPAFNPATGLFYVTARETCATFYAWRQEFKEDRDFFGGTGVRAGRGYGAVRAIDPVTGAVQWESKQFTPSVSGLLTTASGLLFGGDADGSMTAYDALTGRILWNFQTGASIQAAPATVMMGGKQLVLIGSGSTFFAFGLPDTRQ